MKRLAVIASGIVFCALSIFGKDAELSKPGTMGSLTNWLTIVNDLNIRLKVFEPTGNGGNASFGFEYAFHKEATDWTICDHWTTNVVTSPSGGSITNVLQSDALAISFELDAKGDVAFDNTMNPNDFLETGGDLRLRYAGFMKPRPVVPEDIVKFQPLVYLDLKTRARLESNQTFSKKQGAYGLSLGLTLLDPGSADWLSRYNLFDYPFAAIRRLTGCDKTWSPSGTFPVLLVGLDLVDPISDSARFVVDADKSTYWRANGEVSFKTDLASIQGKRLYLGAGYRYFQELSASAAIQGAKQDYSHYIATYLEYRGVSVSYTNGKLPLDHKDDHVFALGYKLNF